MQACEHRAVNTGEFSPLSRAFLSTQSPMMAPSNSTDPATTRPYTAVRSKLFPYNSTRNTATAKFHMRSPCRTNQQRCQFIKLPEMSKNTDIQKISPILLYLHWRPLFHTLLLFLNNNYFLNK